MEKKVTPSTQSVDALLRKYHDEKNAALETSVGRDGGAIPANPFSVPIPEVPETSAIDELMAMTGMEGVKEAVKRQINYHRIMEMRKQAGRKVPKRLMHMLLTGNPGTGKTTVARLIGRIFKDEKILRLGHLVEANRATLVGQWIGESEQKTSELLAAASGGILFIDEIYSLVETDSGHVATKDFGMKVIDTLMPVLSNPDADVMIIGAGYPSKIKTFLRANPGLASRFPQLLDFPDFTVQQLKQIVVNELAKYEFTLTTEAEECLERLLNLVVTVKNHGNARLAITIANNYIIPNLCDRLVKCGNPDSMDIEQTGTVLPEDLPDFGTLFPLDKSLMRTVGFIH